MNFFNGNNPLHKREVHTYTYTQSSSTNVTSLKELGKTKKKRRQLITRQIILTYGTTSKQIKKKTKTLKNGARIIQYSTLV